MAKHRLASSNAVVFHNITQPFSCFSFVEENFHSRPAIHRCFSLGRAFGAKILIQESIPAEGFIEDENSELKILFPSYKCSCLFRLSFWNANIKSVKELENCQDSDLAGYAIIKEDEISDSSSKLFKDFHIFEAVFRKYPHDHNYIPCQPSFNVKICGRNFRIPGVLYCQQNGLNKACAHVALRSLISSLMPEQDLPYSFMNNIARSLRDDVYNPGNGLSVEDMERILSKLKIPYNDLDYSEVSKSVSDIRTRVPYQKYLYAGIESGCGGLLGFRMDGPKAKPKEKHIIPFYGHTFNKDTWTPDADAHYFNVGGGIGYIPSESWTSSFIGHDDNFGPNFCVPRLYVKPKQAEYVIELQKPKVKYGGIIAEAQSLQFLYSVTETPHLNMKNEWITRLVFYSRREIQKVVLRAVCIEKEKYLLHLENIQDWEGNRELTVFPRMFSKLLPDVLWVVEVSLPQLFPANERKLGEIVMNATQAKDKDKDKDVDYNLFLFARLPSQYIILKGASQYNNPTFLFKSSQLKSHVELIHN